MKTKIFFEFFPTMKSLLFKTHITNKAISCLLPLAILICSSSMGQQKNDLQKEKNDLRR